jgi:hypothetical protein
VAQNKKNAKFIKKSAFNSKLEEAYFCAEQGGKSQCLICLQVIGVLEGVQCKQTLQHSSQRKI